MGHGRKNEITDNQTLRTDILLVEGLKVSLESSIPAFIILLLIYIFIMVSNIGLVVLITTERSLHQPMYLLFCNMSVNDALGATVIIPHLLSNIFVPSSDRFIPYIDCVIQAFYAHFYAGATHTILMIMAFDRYSHLAVYIIMFVSGFIIIILHRFPNLSDYRKLASILFHVVPPAMNAIIYGLQIKVVRQKIFIMFSRKRTTVAEVK
ncbi:olfactory receptor 8B4-like [Dicentrarchus labrax]|uniref:olfactory receptor 8B4-like n=1 Tax=Dicentrarchus labrax TaxID=13489 RepID=UPI0021F68835|nr:olfactory receptor 8B4-like [Dicentrarchus labrax]